MEKIMILGVGNILYADDGVGIRVVERLNREYNFPDNVDVVDGGVLGINLLGVISHADQLIVVDAVLNKGVPGDLHRLSGDQVPNRIVAKNSLHQVDLLEALTLCTALDNAPETVIVGVEPERYENLELEMTSVVESRVEDLMKMALDELTRLGGTFTVKAEADYSERIPT